LKGEKQPEKKEEPKQPEKKEEPKQPEKKEEPKQPKEITADSVKDKIHEAMKTHNYNEKNIKNILKALEKDYQEIKGKDTLEKAIEAVRAANKSKLSAFQSAVIEKIEKAKNETGFGPHMKKYG